MISDPALCRYMRFFTLPSIALIGLLCWMLEPDFFTTWPVSSASTLSVAGVDLVPLDSSERAHISDAYGKLPLSFEANQGQTDAQVKFLARGSGYTIFLTPTEAVLSLEQHPWMPSLQDSHADNAARTGKSAVVRMRLANANRVPQISGDGELTGKLNYLIGADQASWQRNVSLYSKVRYEQVYPNIDLVYYGNQQQLEYDYVVKPGGNPRLIKMHCDGADKVRITSEGELVVSIGNGEVKMRRPVIYQLDESGERNEIAGRFKLSGRHEVSFRVKGYDKSKSLVIDPVLTYSTYLGGGLHDYAYGIAVDTSGSAYVTGVAGSNNFPTTPGAYQTTPKDIFITKLNSSGSALVYSTFLGGSSSDNAYGIAVDQSNNAIVTGSTDSADFPLVNSLKTRSQLYRTTDAANWVNSNSGLATDVRAIAVHPTTSSLVYAGTNGGFFKSTDAGNTWAAMNSGLPVNLYVTAIAIDPVTPTTIYVGTGVNAVYKSTDEGSSWFPANNGLPTFSPNISAVVIDPSSPATVYAATNSGVYKSTNGGGNWGAVNNGLIGTNIGSLVIDPNAPGTLYASPISSSAVYKTTNGGGNWVIANTGLSLLSVASLAADPIASQTVYAATNGGVYKTTNGGANWGPINSGLPSFLNLKSIAIPPGQNQVIYTGSSGGQNGGVYKTSNAGSSWSVINAGLWSTYITALVCSPASLTTVYAAANTSAGDYDAFVARLSPNGQSLVFSTLLGGTAPEVGYGIEVDLSGNIYVTGSTQSTNFPTVNAAQAGYNDGESSSNAFVTKINAAGNAYIYSTYLGGTSIDVGNDIAVDVMGNAYVAGNTQSANFPSVNAFQPTFGGSSDVFVAKYGPGGSVSFATFLGGSGEEKGYGITVDGAGSVYVTGQTASNNFPLANPLQATIAGLEDVFVTKFNSQGSALVYSTFLGGETTDVGRGIAVDGLGNAYVGGFTRSQRFPSVRAVKTKSNFYKSTNSGGSWSNYNYGLTAPIVALVVNPANSQIIYAGTRSNGVFKSVDNGYNWTAVNNGLTDLLVNTLVIDPVTPSTLYAGTQGTGVFKSIDSGVSWTLSNTGMGNRIVLSMAIDPITTSTLYAGTYGSSLYKSINSGASWFVVNASLDFVQALVIDPQSPTTLYAGENSSPGGLFKSLDGGMNWQPINNGLPGPYVVSLAIDPVTPSTLYVGCNGIHKSIDGGANWSLIFLQATRLTVDPGSPQTLYAVTNPGVQKSTNGGSTWTALTNGLDTQVSPGVVAVDPLRSTSVYFGSVANFTGDDAFAVKINAAGSALQYATFLGSGNGFGIALDSNNSAYVTGLIHAGGLLTTPGAFDTTGGGLDDAFVVKLDPSWSISGVVTATGGTPLSGATITLAGGSQTQTVVTGGDGVYLFPLVREGGNYVLSAFKIGYDFTPQIFNVSNLDSDRIANFSGVFVTYDLSGHIAVGPAGLGGVTVALSGSATGTIITDMNGDYSIAAPKYGNYTLTPALPGYFFAPVSQSFTNLVSNQTANFAAIAGYPISGQVTRNSVGISGISVSLSGTESTTTTDSNGYYSLNAVAGGSYYVTPASSSYTFIPPTQFVANLNSPQTLNFEAVRLPGPNGRIAFVSEVGGGGGSGAEIYTMNDEGGGLVRVTNNTSLDSSPDWSPDGRKIVFTSLRVGEYEIYSMNSDGTSQINLTNDSSIDTDPTWSPNGTKIAFISYRVGSTGHLFTMDPDGSNQTRVTTAIAAEGHPSWSPDGTRIVYQSYQHGVAELYIVNADGSNPTRLTNSPDYEMDPEWSPDGSKIVFVYGLNSFDQEIYVINADGTGRVRLTNNTVQDYAPAWSPDGTKIIFSAEAGGPLNNREIFVMSIDGSNRVRLTNAAQADYEPSWQVHSYAHNPMDFDGDEKTDVSVFRPSSGFWYILQSSNTAFRADQFGVNSDKITPGDYDGDNRADVAVFRPSNGYWYILKSSDHLFQAVQFGQNDDIPTPADFDGDGKTDFCLYRPSNNYFYLLYSSDNSFHFLQWGASGDLPVIGDYDGDNKDDFGIFRPSVASFYILRSSNGIVIGQQFGLGDDKPIAADFDGDGKTDIAVYRPSPGEWYYVRSSDNNLRGIAWGTNGDVPTAGDYDGDGKADIAVFRPSGGVFYILQSTTNTLRADQFGISGDLPVPSANVP